MIIRASRYAMPLNPYDIGPEDPKEPLIDTQLDELTVDFAIPVIFDADGTWDYADSDIILTPAPNDSVLDRYVDDYGVELADASYLIEAISDALEGRQELQDIASGEYTITGTAAATIQVSVEYTEKYLGKDEDGDPAFDTNYFYENAESAITSLKLSNVQVEAGTVTAATLICNTDEPGYGDDIQEIGQEFTSENTSINSDKLPAVFKMVQFEPGTVNLDYGGGRFDNVAEYLTQYDVINLVYDPFNRSAEHNREVLRLVKEHNGADTATCSNVLNVIKEPEVRINVLNNIKKLLKPNGIAYITVYEGKGAEGPTKSGYQLHRKTADYMDEVQSVFPGATRKGKLIVCPNTSSVSSSTECCIDDDYDAIDRSGSDSDVEFAALAYMYGMSSINEAKQRYNEFTPDEVQKAVNYYYQRGLPMSMKHVNSTVQVNDSDHMDALQYIDDTVTANARAVFFDKFGFDEQETNDNLVIETSQVDHTYARVEVRAELSYDGMRTLAETLDQNISHLDQDAYFDDDEPGIISAMVNIRKVEAAMDSIAYL